MRAIAAAVMVLLLAGAAVASAQQMPDPSLIHGKALPAPELPAGTVTVRVVRESIGNNVAGQQVRVTAGGTTRTATTDEEGRAEFRDLPRTGDARAESTVDGEALVSDPFMVPSSGGLRVILVAGIARAAERRKAEEAASLAAPAAKGQVVFGENSRILIEFEGDALQVFYVLEIVNNARTRIDTGGPVIIELPKEEIGAATLEGSSPAASIRGNRVIINGPFAPGVTPVQVGYQMPHFGPDVTISQTWPVALQRVTVGVEKLGTLAIASSQFTNTGEVPSDSGKVFAVGNGGAMAAGSTLVINLTGVPAHSRAPRYIALGLAGIVVALGVWLSISGSRKNSAAREALTARREQLLEQLAQLEAGKRDGKLSPERYTSKRQRIVGELEQIYGELDSSGAGPQGGGEGVAA